MPDPVIVTSSGHRAPYNVRDLLGSLVEAGVPADVAKDRVARLTDLLRATGVDEVSTDAIRHALEEIAAGRSTEDIVAILRGDVADAPRMQPGAPGALSSALTVSEVFIGPHPYVHVEYNLPPGPAAYLRVDAVEGLPIARHVALEGRTGTVQMEVGRHDLPEHSWLSFHVETARGVPVPGVEPVMLRTSAPPFAMQQRDGAGPGAGAGGEETEEERKAREELETLIKLLNRLINNYNLALGALDWMPMVRWARLLNTIRALIRVYNSVPEEVWGVMILFLACHNEYLVKLSVDELKLIVVALLAQARLDLEAEDDEPIKKKLETWIKKLEETLARWEADWVKDKAVAALVALKEFLIEYHPEILEALREYFGVDAEAEVKRFMDYMRKGILGKIIKKELKKVVTDTLIRRMGKQAARLANPWVAMAFDLAEAGLFFAIVDYIKDVRKEIDRTLSNIACELARRGAKFPQDIEHVWLRHPDFEGATVTLCAFVSCAEQRPDGCIKWGKPCRVRFTNGKHCATMKLGPHNLVQGEIYKLPFNLLDFSVVKSSCVRAGSNKVACYTYLDGTITNKYGKVVPARFITGVRCF